MCGALGGFHGRRDVGEWRSDDDIAVVDAATSGLNAGKKGASVRLSFVHLPISRDYAATFCWCSFVGKGLHAR